MRRSYEDPLGTWSTNLIGSLHLLEALKPLQHPCALLMVSTDKVYKNRKWLHGYREGDPLGCHDPYCASKAGAEIACARASNVFGGPDWAVDRILPDAMRALALGESI